MAKERDREESDIIGTPTPGPDTQLKIRWDSANMRSIYANVCNVAGTREEIVLFFGMNQSWDASQKEMTVQVSDRIVLSPFVAKRLAILLQNVIRNYETKFGALDVEPRRPGDSTVS
jgi:hypothetical protein